jgi:hypothetical protein
METLSPEEYKKCIGYNSTRTYKLMGCAANPKQPLHLLYPGRFLLPGDNYNGSNIPHEDMEGLEKTRKMSQALRTAYDIEKEALSRHLGGNHKIYPHPAVEPDAIINDPRLSGVSLEFGGDPSFKNDGDAIPLQNPIEKAREMVATSRVENAIERPPSSRPAFQGYQWKNNLEEVYPTISSENLPTADAWSTGTVEESPRDTFQEHFEWPKPPKNKKTRDTTPYITYGIVIVFFIFIMVMLCFLGWTAL